MSNLVDESITLALHGRRCELVLEKKKLVLEIQTRARNSCSVRRLSWHPLSPFCAQTHSRLFAMLFSIFITLFATSSASRCARPAVALSDTRAPDVARAVDGVVQQLESTGSVMRVAGLADALRLRGGLQQVETMEEWVQIRDSERRLVVIDFTAVWCGPCQRIAPAYAELADEFAETALLLKVDVDELPELAAELGVSSMPTFLFFKGGGEVDTMRGADVKGLRVLLEKYSA